MPSKVTRSSTGGRRSALPEIDQRVADEIRKDRHQYFRDMVDGVVDHATIYAREKERDDSAHRARLSTRWEKLFRAILGAADAYRAQGDPITQADVDHYLQMESLAAARRKPTDIEDA